MNTNKTKETINDISAHVMDVYGLEVSDSTIGRVTDKILPVVKEWQQRPLESVYAVVFMDAIHYHVRSEGRIIKKKKQMPGLASRCRLTLSEYLRQRALGYEPKAVQPDACFVLCEKLDRLTEPPFSEVVNAEAEKPIGQLSGMIAQPQTKYTFETFDSS